MVAQFLYGLLGMKLYFCYAPLMLLGCAMLERPEDMDRLLVVAVAARILAVAHIGPDCHSLTTLGRDAHPLY
jgi:hypothetical protein